jgi:hypothetical protein
MYIFISNISLKEEETDHFKDKHMLTVSTFAMASSLTLFQSTVTYPADAATDILEKNANIRA